MAPGDAGSLESRLIVAAGGGGGGGAVAGGSSAFAAAATNTSATVATTPTASVELTYPGPRVPPDDFSFGKVKKNKKKGTAKLTIEIVEGPGELKLAKTKKVKADDEAV